MCGAYVRIAKLCSFHIWKPESLLNILCFPKPYYGLVECFEVALSILDSYSVEEMDNMQDCSYTSVPITSGCELGRVGEKRPLYPQDVLNVKRQKLDTLDNFNLSSQNEGKKEYAERMWSSLLSFIEYLEPPGGKANMLEKREAYLTALSMLCIVLCKYPRMKLSHQISCQMLGWIPWICEQVFFFFL